MLEVESLLDQLAPLVDQAKKVLVEVLKTEPDLLTGHYYDPLVVSGGNSAYGTAARLLDTVFAFEAALNPQTGRRYTVG